LWGLFPTVSGPCDKQDFSSASEVDADGSASIYLYDMVYDGVGLTVLAFDRMTELLDKASERLQECGCDTDAGCFRCIANPHANEFSSKRATRRILTRLQESLASKCTVTEVENDAITGEFVTTKPCSACSIMVKAGDRFCSNCGEKQSA
jgi:ATP-dependent helicase YprA (DUF1998 family)